MGKPIKMEERKVNIKFNNPSITKKEETYLLDSLQNNVLSGDGKYTARVCDFFRQRFNIKNMLLTTSGTTALEMAALLICLRDGDEVIVPSFTFSSTVNAFMLSGAKPVFCDIRTDTLNMDETLVEGLITNRTKAIYVVHYAGIPVEMNVIKNIAEKYDLFVIEDAAQAVGSTYKGQYAGTMSELGCYSFHESKNYIMGEGGAILLNEEKWIERAEIIREKGTNRKQALQGVVDKYTWHDIGSSFLPSDILAALLYAQLQRFDEIMDKRMRIWNIYDALLEDMEMAGKLKRQTVPGYITHNAHMYYIILPENKIRDRLIASLKSAGIAAYFHYIPLHSSPMGQKLGYNADMLPLTEEYAARLLRLPLYADMTPDEAAYVTDQLMKAL